MAARNARRCYRQLHRDCATLFQKIQINRQIKMPAHRPNRNPMYLMWLSRSHGESAVSVDE